MWHVVTVFTGLSIHIARFHSQNKTGRGGAYSQDKNTCTGTLAENGRGAYTQEGAYSWNTTVLEHVWFPPPGEPGTYIHLVYWCRWFIIYYHHSSTYKLDTLRCGWDMQFFCQKCGVTKWKLVWDILLDLWLSTTKQTILWWASIWDKSRPWWFSLFGMDW